ncbi:MULTISPECIES: ATP-grasp domain-containing protein [unclassified Nocardiopsis]|uniref:ATP-grasp domain-containing protein n=1 Tax=unclassified Nocardiopsis TaxID=2649073 RepID=UPI001359BBF2|nr:MULTISPECIES: ATP-grasp domain-containing protein [unclassified Nocardiopsis]
MVRRHTPPHLVFVESNTTGSGRLFCARARDRGLRPLLVSRDPERYPYVSEDGVPAVVADTSDPGTVLRVCRGLEGPVAGVTSSSEYFASTAASVARGLGLPSPDAAAVARCRDKAAQRRTLARAGVPVPAFHEVRSVDQGVSLASGLGRTVVVKPVLGSGSDGVRACRGPGEVAEALGALLGEGSGRADRALVEEYMEGPEFSVETFDDRVVGVTAKHLGEPPRFLETGHDHPAPLPADLESAVAGVALAALEALGLGWGPAHVELRVTASGPRIVEVNPRLAGGMIPALVEAATGVDLIAATVARVLGEPPDLAPTRSDSAAIRFLFAARSGTVTLATTEEARRSPGVARADVTVPEGRRLTVTHTFRDRIGHVVAAAPTPAEAGRRAERALGLLGVLITPEEEVTVPAD